MVNGVVLKPLTVGHWPDVKRIYEQGIRTGIATLETSVPEWEVWNHDHLKSPRLIAENDGKMAGWVALTAVSGRCVYGGVGEVSVYIDENSRGRGIGKLLLQKAVADSESEGLWTLQAGILEENTASIHLHQSCGFRIVGIRERLGKLNGKWKNIVLMERRSSVTGIGGP